jgi:hypothetical protein
MTFLLIVNIVILYFSSEFGFKKKKSGCEKSISNRWMLQRGSNQSRVV